MFMVYIYTVMIVLERCKLSDFEYKKDFNNYEFVFFQLEKYFLKLKNPKMKVSYN